MKAAPIPAERFPELLTTPPRASATWNMFSAFEVDPPAQVTMSCADHLVSVLFSGTCRFREIAEGRSTEVWTGPGAVHVIPAKFEGMWEGRNRVGRFRAFSLFIPEAFLSRVIVEDWGVEPGGVEIIHRFSTRDPVIESILARLAFEARSGSPSGSMYAESACEFLTHHLVRAHSSLAEPPPRRCGGLPDRRLKLILDYVEEHLAQRITLRTLAELGGVSPRHLERAFRQAVGVPPHAYVMRKRVAAARSMLVSHPTLPIHEIAARLGFTSPSHLASVFRRQTGSTPSAYRQRQSD